LEEEEEDDGEADAHGCPLDEDDIDALLADSD